MGRLGLGFLRLGFLVGFSQKELIITSISYNGLGGAEKKEGKRKTHLLSEKRIEITFPPERGGGRKGKENPHLKMAFPKKA